MKFDDKDSFDDEVPFDAVLMNLEVALTVVHGSGHFEGIEPVIKLIIPKSAFSVILEIRVDSDTFLDESAAQIGFKSPLMSL